MGPSIQLVEGGGEYLSLLEIEHRLLGRAAHSLDTMAPLKWFWIERPSGRWWKYGRSLNNASVGLRSVVSFLLLLLMVKVMELLLMLLLMSCIKSIGLIEFCTEYNLRTLHFPQKTYQGVLVFWAGGRGGGHWAMQPAEMCSYFDIWTLWVFMCMNPAKQNCYLKETTFLPRRKDAAFLLLIIYTWSCWKT